MKKLILVAIVAALAAIIALRFVALGKVEETKSIEDVHNEKGVPVNVFEVTPTNIDQWAKFTGTVEGARQVNLFTNSPARVMKILKEEGDTVRAGEVVLRLDPASGPMSQTTYRNAQLQYDSATRNFERIQALYEAGAVSKSEFEDVRDAVELAKAKLQDVNLNLDIESPIDGVVTQILTEVGNNADPGQALAVVANTKKVKIKLDVSDRDRRLIAVGQRARCTKVVNGDRCSFGTVTKIALSADPMTRLFAVDVSMDNAQGNLRPGVIETVEILVNSAAGALVVPPAALIERDGKQYVYTVDGSGIAHRKTVETGIVTSDAVQITAGVSSGGRVVTFGQNLLEDGVKVNVRKAQTL